MADKPAPYKFCDAHFKANCPICEPGVAKPNPPAIEEPPPPVKHDALPHPSDPPVAVTPAPVAPKVSDPAAQKVIDAAKDYADAVQAMTVISDQVKQTRELLSALEKKLAETKKIAQDKLKITMDASK